MDVNTPLLEALADDSRGSPCFVQPGENVEAKVSGVFSKLHGPVLAEPVLREEEQTPAAAARTQQLLPARLPDLYEDDQLVVLGRYNAGDGEIRFTLRGKNGATERSFRFAFSPAEASVRNAFVPRLWASRRIGELIDEIRRQGADSTTPTEPVPGNARLSSALVSAGRPFPAVSSAASALPANPRLQELTKEIMRLSTEFGILTEYTAFLATEGTNLSKPDAILEQAQRNFQERAIATRSGQGSMNQSLNNVAQRTQRSLNNDNSFIDANMNRVIITNVQQVNDRAFFRRDNRWVDSRLLNAAPTAGEPETVVPGTAAYRALVDKMVAANQQGALALDGDILLQDGNRTLLLRNNM